MKYFYIGSSILIVLFAISLFFSTLICRKTTETAAILTEAAQLMDDDGIAAAQRKTEDAAACWTRHEHFLGALISHDELDEIAEGFRRLDAYAKEDARDEFRSQCHVLIFRLEHIGTLDFPFYYNFLSRGLDPSLSNAV